MSELKYPIGMQNFAAIRERGFVYVDKTAYIHQLVTTGVYYFLSRPRRFGKSLLLSTIEAYFKGRKKLFDGLDIAQYPHDWHEHPVLHLDLNSQKYDDKSSVDDILLKYVSEWEGLYGRVETEMSLSLRFAGVIKRAYEKTGRHVVILVDEYDKPLLMTMHDEALQNEYRNTLKAFYGVLKSMDGYVKFAMLTGVTKFGKISVFSDLNNLNDISFDSSYSGICGITEQELDCNFGESIKELSSAAGLNADDCKAKLKEEYDGYKFTVPGEHVYNPFSLLSAFYKKAFGHYWFSTGTPTFLVELLKRAHFDLSGLSDAGATASSLGSLEIAHNSPIPFLYQSGYLTIKSFNPVFSTYKLDFPNREVKEGFINFLLPYYTRIAGDQTSFVIERFVDDVLNGDVDSFMTRLRSLFADFPYEKVQKLELHYHNVMYLIMTLMGFYVRTEYHTSSGRMDLVIKTESYIYVMEFKLDGSAEEVLAQIESKGYALPFESDGRKIIKIGANFSSKTRNIDKWVVK